MKKMFSKYPDVVSTRELTNMLSVGKKTVYRLLQDGEIKSIKVGREYRVLKSFVIEYLNHY